MLVTINELVAIIAVNNCNCRLGLNLPALGEEDRKNMFAAMDENGDGAISFNEWLDFSMKTIVAQIQ